MILDLESSAAAKLLVEEAESAALAAHLDAAVVAGDQVVSCVLLETELRRLAELERAQLRTAGLFSGQQLHSLDASHVASALRWQADAMLSYDARRRRRRRTRASGCWRRAERSCAVKRVLEPNRVEDGVMTTASPVDQLLRLRQHQRDGHRSPHKPLLVLLAMGRLSSTGSSALTWSEVELLLAELIAEFGAGSATSRTQSAAYPFTRLRSDGVWTLDRDVPMDLVGPLRAGVTGRLDSALEAQLAHDPAVLSACAQSLALSQFPVDVAQDVLDAVGIDWVTAGDAELTPGGRRRDPVWRRQVLQAWDGSCAFCGFDGQVAGSPVGIEAAHVRWFAFGGPDTLDNGLALCMLHHKLFDRGVLGLDDSSAIRVSAVYSARTEAGRAVYDLHGRVLTPRPGTAVPAPQHVAWHGAEVFRGTALVA